MQAAERVEELAPVRDRPERKLGEHKIVDGRLVLLEEADQRRLSGMKVVDPDIGVDEDHGCLLR